MRLVLDNTLNCIIKVYDLIIKELFSTPSPRTKYFERFFFIVHQKTY